MARARTQAPAAGAAAATSPTVELGRTGLLFRSGRPADEPLRELRGKAGAKVFREMSLNEPVIGVITGSLGATVALAVGAAVLGFALAIILALATAGRPHARAVSRVAELTAISMPNFWIGILLLAVFSFQLRWFPVLGGQGIQALVLPWITLALPITGVLSLVCRDGLERALEQPFAVTTRARGSGELRLLLRHALRHAILPVLTLSTWSLGELLGGVVVVETVFARQGIGEVLVTAVGGRDFPVVTGVVVLSALTFSLINIGVDVAYRAIDPRLRQDQAVTV